MVHDEHVKFWDISDTSVVIFGWKGNLGRDLSLALHKAGCHLTLINKKTDAENWAGNLSTEDNLPLILPVDNTSRSSLEECLEQTLSTHGKIDSLINLAALDTPPHIISPETGKFEEFTIEFHESMMKSNVIGSILLSQIFGKAIVDSGGGSFCFLIQFMDKFLPSQKLINTFKNEGAFVKPATYTPSKSALTTFTKYL